MRILLLAPGLLGESLALQLTAADNDLEVLLKPDQLKGHPALVIWSIEAITSFNAIRRELAEGIADCGALAIRSHAGRPQ